MPLTDAQKQRIRYHLDYSLLSLPTGLSLGDPQVVTWARYLLDQNMVFIQPDAEPLVLEVVGRLDCIIKEMDQARRALVIAQTGDTKFRENAVDLLADEYRRWQMRLADMLAAQQNPVSNAAQGMFGGGVIEGGY